MVAAGAMFAGASCQAPAGETEQILTKRSAINTVLVDSQQFTDAKHWDLVSSYSTIRYPDLNHDGRADVCGRGPEGIWCATDDGTGKLVGDSLWQSILNDTNGFNQAQYYGTIAFPDVNGDNLPDLCARSIAGMRCSLSTGGAFGAFNLWSGFFKDPTIAGDIPWTQPEYYSTISFADLNHDNRADVCGRTPSGVWCALSTGSSFGTATRWNPDFNDGSGFNDPQYYKTIQLADVSGDGKADLCGRGIVGVYCAVSTGSTFGPLALWDSTFANPTWSGPEYYTTIQFSDINHDGKADLCGRGPDGFDCGLSTGTGFQPTTPWLNVFSDGNGFNLPQYYSTIKVANGILCGRGYSGIYCAASNSVNAFVSFFHKSSYETDAVFGQPQYYRTIAVTTDLKIMERSASGIRSTPVYATDNLTLNSAADVTARRTALIQKVWGRSTIDTTQGVDSNTVLSSSNIDVQPLPAGVTVRRYEIRMPTAGGIPFPPSGRAEVQGLADHFIPATPTTKLVIMNPGHSCRYTSVPYQDSETVRELLAEGYAVLATYMPQVTPIVCDELDSSIAYHSQLFDPALNFRPAAGGNPMIYFLDPVRRSLNHVIATYGYTQISMTGLSGGGWTTGIYAALDTRVKVSIPIAGSEPFDMRLSNAIDGGDAEQENEPSSGNDFFMFSSGGTQIVTGWKDLFLMGASGTGRRQIQVLNRNDTCCFSQAFHNGVGSPWGPTWDSAVRTYEIAIRQRLAQVGPGSFRVEINEADDCLMTGTCEQPNSFGRHEFSKNTRVNVILAELNGSHAYIGASGNSTAFGRGRAGTLLRYNGSWADSGLAMVGTPAVLKGAVASEDIFYRNNGNQLTHATFNGTTWALPNDVSGTIISDPSAVSWGAGRIDVTAVGADYRIRHWWYDGSWHNELLSTGSTFAVGRAAIATSGASRLDIYFRGHDAGLYHLSSTTGKAPFALESLNKTIRSFPTASSSTNTLFVFVTGTDNRLYQGQKVGAGAWSWTNVSSAALASTVDIDGSPTVGPGSRNVYVRLAANQTLGSYSSPVATTNWTFSNLGQGPFISSPTMTNSGPYIVATGHDVWLAGQLGWQSLGGYIQR